MCRSGLVPFFFCLFVFIALGFFHFFCFISVFTAVADNTDCVCLLLFCIAPVDSFSCVSRKMRMRRREEKGKVRTGDVRGRPQAVAAKVLHRALWTLHDVLFFFVSAPFFRPSMRTVRINDGKSLICGML